MSSQKKKRKMISSKSFAWKYFNRKFQQIGKLIGNDAAFPFVIPSKEWLSGKQWAERKCLFTKKNSPLEIFILSQEFYFCDIWGKEQLESRQQKKLEKLVVFLVFCPTFFFF